MQGSALFLSTLLVTALGYVIYNGRASTPQAQADFHGVYPSDTGRLRHADEVGTEALTTPITIRNSDRQVKTMEEAWMAQNDAV